MCVCLVSLTFASMDLVFAPNAAMRKLVAYTHFLPDTWRGHCHTYDVRDAFCALFQYKVILFLRELTCIFSTPFVLFFVLPRYADEVLEFIRSYSVHEDGVGDVCVFSKFDLREHGDSKYGSPRLQRTAEAPGLAMNGGKLEKSWLNFRAQNPSWEGATTLKSGGPDLLQRLTHFQRHVVDEAAAATMYTGAGGAAREREAVDEVVDQGGARTMYDSVGSASSAGLAGSLILQSPELPSMRQALAGSSESGRHAQYSRSQALPKRTVRHGAASEASIVAASVPKMQQGMFSNEESVTLPMQSVNFPHAENYFYWLEELRDKAKR
jgi:hypothetical protein